MRGLAWRLGWDYRLKRHIPLAWAVMLLLPHPPDRRPHMQRLDHSLLTQLDHRPLTQQDHDPLTQRDRHQPNPLDQSTV